MRWYVAGAFVRPNGITSHSNEPIGVLIAVLCIERSLIGVTQYPFSASIVVKNLAPINWSKQSVSRGKGYLSFTV